MECAVADQPKKPPPNIEEFNIIAGLAFAQLYKAFPARIDINREAIAKEMGIDTDLSHRLPSGRPFSEILAYTLSWLQDEKFINGSGPEHASWQKLVLSQKGLAAMNAVPAEITESYGSKLATASGESSAASKVAEVMGSFFGSFTKSWLGNG
jgi:hypothetical protein